MEVKLFPGLAQKITPIFVILTAVAWFLIIVGFGIGSNRAEKIKDGDEQRDFPLEFASPEGPNDREEPQSYPFWMAIFSGVAAMVSALLTATFWKPFSMIFGAITAFLSVLFLTSLGMILYINGTTIREVLNEDMYEDVDIPGWYALEFAGAFLAVVFWIPVMILWFFYDVEVRVRTN